MHLTMCVVELGSQSQLRQHHNHHVLPALPWYVHTDPPSSVEWTIGQTSMLSCSPDTKCPTNWPSSVAPKKRPNRGSVVAALHFVEIEFHKTSLLSTSVVGKLRGISAGISTWSSG